jgi:hypothetical protein
MDEKTANRNPRSRKENRGRTASSRRPLRRDSRTFWLPQRGQSFCRGMKDHTLGRELILTNRQAMC